MVERIENYKESNYFKCMAKHEINLKNAWKL